MAVQCMYVEAHYLPPLLEWLAKRPEGKCRVLIGEFKTFPRNPELLIFEAFHQNPTLGEWLADKINNDEMEILIVEEKPDFEQGVVVTLDE